MRLQRAIPRTVPAADPTFKRRKLFLSKPRQCRFNASVDLTGTRERDCRRSQKTMVF